MANNFFAKLQQGLSKTRDNIAKGIDNVVTDTLILMMISMRSLKRLLSWETSESMLPARSWTDFTSR